MKQSQRPCLNAAEVKTMSYYFTYLFVENKVSFFMMDLSLFFVEYLYKTARCETYTLLF